MDILIFCNKHLVEGFYRYELNCTFNDPFKHVTIDVSELDWNRSVIIDKLIRSKFSQDMVEAIINNHFLKISDWLEKKFEGEEVTFDDPEYTELQEWRVKCKEAASLAFDEYPEYKPE